MHGSLTCSPTKRLLSASRWRYKRKVTRQRRAFLTWTRFLPTSRMTTRNKRSAGSALDGETVHVGTDDLSVFRAIQTVSPSNALPAERVFRVVIRLVGRNRVQVKKARL